MSAKSSAQLSRLGSKRQGALVGGPRYGRADHDWVDQRRANPETLMRLREAVAAGTYSPPVDALVESIVDQFVDRVDWPPVQHD